jgi:hypothetical protein
MMIQVSIPTESGNAAYKDGRLREIMQKAIGELKPEAAYFTTYNGQRTAFIVLNMTDSSEMPHVAERFFLGLNAKVDFMPAMNAQDLAAGMEKTAKAG